MIRGLATAAAVRPAAIYKEEAPGVVTVMSLFGATRSRISDDASGGVGSGFRAQRRRRDRHERPRRRPARCPPAGGRKVYVEFADGNQVEAEVAATTRTPTSRCLGRPEGADAAAAAARRSDDVEVGTPVAAIGSPFGERQSLSVGVVSAVDRSISGLTAFQIAGAIQTDAAINPGNSGGPLVDPTAR